MATTSRGPQVTSTETADKSGMEFDDLADLKDRIAKAISEAVLVERAAEEDR